MVAVTSFDPLMNPSNNEFLVFFQVIYVTIYFVLVH